MQFSLIFYFLISALVYMNILMTWILSLKAFEILSIKYFNYTLHIQQLILLDN